MSKNLFNKFQINMFSKDYFNKRKINKYFKDSVKQNNIRIRKDCKIDCWNMVMFILICVLNPEQGYITLLHKTKLFLINSSKNCSKIFSSISAPGICKARKRFSSLILKKIWQIDIIKIFSKSNSVKLWNDFRVCSVDGTTFTLNKSKEILSKFPLLNKARFPKMIVCILYDVYSKIPLDIESDNYTCGERKLLSKIVENLKSNTLLLLDRGYPAYWMYHKLNLHSINFIIRIGTHLKYKIIKKNKYNDLIIELNPCRLTKNNCKANLAMSEFNSLPEKIRLRLIKTTMKGFRTRYIITSLIDNKKYSYTDICKLYCDRWIIENFYRDLKHILKIEKFHSKYIDGIYQEIYASMILTIILQKYISTASKLHGIPYEEISFKKTFNLLSDIILLFNFVNNDSDLIEKLFFKFIACSSQKLRPDRHYKRVMFRKTRCIDYKSR